MIALALLLAAAGATSGSTLARLTPKQLNEISAHCHSPRTWLYYNANGELHIKPSSTAKYTQVDCILSELKVRGAEPMAFVGNMIPE
jgi:hypothetical protein